MKLPQAYRKVYPRSFVLCVYPTGSSSLYNGNPTVTITVVDTFDHSQFETVVHQRVPEKWGTFDSYVERALEIEVNGKDFVFASEERVTLMIMHSFEGFIVF